MRRLVVIAVTGIAAAATAGCGGSSHKPVDPRTLLDAATSHPIRAAHTDIDARLQVEGVPRLAAPLRLRLEGPYASAGPSAIPRFDWRLGATALGFPVGGRVISTGANVYLTLYGDSYQLGTATVAAANRRLAELAAAGRPLATNPRSWFGPVRDAGSRNAGGTDCERISAPLRGAAVAADLAPLIGGLGLPEPLGISGRATACVGYDDRVLHELDLDAGLAIPPLDRPRLDGAGGAHLQLDVTLADVNAPQRIEAPRGSYRPITDLLLTLDDLGLHIPLG
jgi:hypothetical protein